MSILTKREEGMSDEIVEYEIGNVKRTRDNLLVHDIEDMELLEFWEFRLKQLKQDFAIVYRRIDNKIQYSIYTNIRKKGSPFRKKD